MTDLHYFIVAGKNDLMLSYNGASTYSRDANLLFIPWLTDGVSVKDVFGFMPTGGGGSVRNHKGSSRRGIYLAAVVPLDDFDIIAVSQYCGSLLDQLKQYIDAKGHISRAEDWNF